MPMPATIRPTTSKGMPFEDVCSLKMSGVSFRPHRLAYIEPMIHMMAPDWIQLLRDIPLAMKKEISVPSRDPAGMEPVIAPCRY